jgi:hypothetical protein
MIDGIGISNYELKENRDRDYDLFILRCSFERALLDVITDLVIGYEITPSIASLIYSKVQNKLRNGKQDD